MALDCWAVDFHDLGPDLESGQRTPERQMLDGCSEPAGGLEDPESLAETCCRYGPPALTRAAEKRPAQEEPEEVVVAYGSGLGSNGNFADEYWC